MWENRVDRTGCVRQSLGVTCAPASAVMLLHHHGIEVNEGEMAYLANTSRGTDVHSMASVVADKLRGQGMSARVDSSSYDACVAREEAFIAAVYMPRIGAHAIYVERLTPTHAVVVDPLEGWRKQVTREVFEEWWCGKIIRVVTAE
jgi:ABC-type bacteriocin/lantibiotic exporter with double-glycine peptidase domain